tara:strand:+ start:2993 stop:3529 length:537 start_codon:yes stop_codon:yes gene_type:complete
MPRSCSLLRQDIKKYLTENYDKDLKILDVGPGEGTYFNLLSDYFNNMDAVEVWEPYIQQYNLKDKYSNVFNENILDFNFDFYDIIIMGDVLEHIEIESAKKLIKNLTKKCNQLLIVVPFNLPQGPKGGVEYEEHKQPDLSDSVMLERYPDLKLLSYNDKELRVKGPSWNGDYCAFIKK